MRNRKNKNIIALLFALFFLAASVSAQTGGNYTITQSVIASGGGQNATGGDFSLDGTIGQPLAGVNSSGGSFSVRGGFWTAQLSPSAAGATIAGRVIVDGASGKGIRNVQLTLTDTATGEIRIVRSGLFGSYRFEDVPTGHSYVLTVSARRFAFAPNIRFITLLEEVTNIDFVGTEQF